MAPLAGSIADIAAPGCGGPGLTWGVAALANPQFFCFMEDFWKIVSKTSIIMIKIIYQSKQSGQKKSSLYKRFSTIYLNYNSCLTKLHFFANFSNVRKSGFKFFFAIFWKFYSTTFLGSFFPTRHLWCSATLALYTGHIHWTIICLHKHGNFMDIGFEVSSTAILVKNESGYKIESQSSIFCFMVWWIVSRPLRRIYKLYDMN